MSDYRTIGLLEVSLRCQQLTSVIDSTWHAIELNYQINRLEDYLGYESDQLLDDYITESEERTILRDINRMERRLHNAKQFLVNHA